MRQWCNEKERHITDRDISSRKGTALQADADYQPEYAGDELDREQRSSLKRVPNLSTELQDITEVEYRKLRLENVVLVGIWTSGTAEDAEVSLRELAALAETAGSVVLAGVLQRRDKPDNATYLGSGKAREVADLVASTGADTIIVDSELSPNQRRNLEDVTKVKVIDRTTLILDIFAQHAKSREGKAQVELAQLEYLLPRLRGWGESMSRQAGGRVGAGDGIGSRGPGETQIELDRRRIRQRMAKLKRDIANMEPARRTQRSNRRRHGLPSVVVVGYTNAGKSSLMNRLTNADVLVENALFATLDPTVRRSETEDGRAYTISDTVGFVRSLPTQLVEAFRSTLEEVAEGHLMLHVVDAAHPDPVGQVNAVHDVLREVDGAEDVPEIIVLSKADLADPIDLAALRSRYPGAVVVSSKTGEGIEELRDRIADGLPRPSVAVSVTIPFDRGDLISRVHTDGEILREEYSEDGTVLEALVDEDLAAELLSVGR
ncbi:GTPase HflX [Flaviflexus ciconiae]|uniref:GTPase HflX n=1 Tax=Flaviflexus ciconiae TaxID=2496867 RepID=A0A3S9PV22_9ACTO|nr:GTPase HflX [Flaviflexus ciconiae]AZQ76199.1 GTPase HflX [Flaviflexus ciconiae]